MKYKYIILIILISVAALVYKSFDKKNDYSFERKILKENIHVCNRSNILSTITEHEFLYQSGNTLVSINQGKKGDSSYVLNLFDLKKKSKVKDIGVSLKYRGMEFLWNDTLFYIDKYKLFSKNISNDKSFQVSSVCDMVYKAFPISPDKYIYIGTKKTGNEYEMGFYQLKYGVSKITKKLETNSSLASVYRNDLIYSGCFMQNDKYIIFYCDKRSDIYIFNSDGEYLRDIHTKENVPDPMIFIFNDMYVYKRGYTYSTTIGICEHNGYLYVLSYRCSAPCIVLDKYSIKTAEYLGSVKIADIREPNRNVNNVFNVDNMIILNLKNKFLVLNFNN